MNKSIGDIQKTKSEFNKFNKNMKILISVLNRLEKVYVDKNVYDEYKRTIKLIDSDLATARDKTKKYYKNNSFNAREFISKYIYTDINISRDNKAKEELRKISKDFSINEKPKEYNMNLNKSSVGKDYIEISTNELIKIIDIDSYTSNIDSIVNTYYLNCDIYNDRDFLTKYNKMYSIYNDKYNFDSNPDEEFRGDLYKESVPVMLLAEDVAKEINNSVSLEANIISERLAFSISIFKYIKITKDQKKNIVEPELKNIVK